MTIPPELGGGIVMMLVTAIAAGKRLSLLCDIILQIVESDKPAVRLHVRSDHLGRFSGIKFLRSLRLDPAERRCQVRLSEQVAFLIIVTAV